MLTQNQSSESDLSEDEIETIEDLEDHQSISLTELKELQGLLVELAELEGWDHKPEGKPVKNDIPNHNITRSQKIEKNVSKKEIENTKALKDHVSIGMNELKELQGLLAELIDLERQAQNTTGKLPKNDIPDYNIIGKHSTEKNVSENEMESTEALRDRFPLSMNEQRKARKRVGSSIKNHMPDHDITQK